LFYQKKLKVVPLQGSINMSIRLIWRREREKERGKRRGKKAFFLSLLPAGARASPPPLSYLKAGSTQVKAVSFTLYGIVLRIR